MTKISWLLVGVIAVMTMHQSLITTQRDNARSDARFFLGLYSGALSGRSCEHIGSPVDSAPADAPGQTNPQGLRL